MELPELSKSQQILDKYPKKPKHLSYAQMAKQFGVKRQLVWSLYNEAPNKDQMLTVKQTKWAQKTAKYGNGTKAALEVYDTKDRKSAMVVSTHNMSKPHVRAYLVKILNDRGLGIEQMASDLRSIIKEGVESKTAEAKDAVKALELAVKLQDLMPSTKIETLNRNLNIDASVPMDDLLTQLQQLTEDNQRLITKLQKK